jgi:hypothetical protein
MKHKLFSVLLLAGILLPGSHAVPAAEGMKEGALDLKSAGPITFGPEGVLFVADSKSAAIVAIDTGDTKAAGKYKALKVQGITEKLAALLGTSADQILINDMAVNPASRNVYLALSRGLGPDAKPVLARVKGDGQIEIVNLDKIKHSRAELPDAPVDGVVGQPNRQSNPRLESITDIAFFEDRLLIAGLSNEEFASTLRAVPFPFEKVANGTSVEIYHGAHGRFETRSPVRTFVPIKVGNEQHVLAAYTCTPLVQFSLDELTPGAKVKGKTIAELGNRNRPLDMIVYQKDGRDYILLANSARGIMKMNADEIQKTGSIESPVRDGTKGLAYETIESWKNIEQLDRFDSQNALVLRRASEGGEVSLESLPLP